VTRSADYFRQALRVTPGGVHSPVRAFRKVGGNPVFIASAAGAELTDVDGRRYTDFCMSFGPLILGHAHPAVREAVIRAVERGWSYGAAETSSLELAELITGNIEWAESIRFVNSGTEAVMSALRLARAATGRSRILKFDGCYHGHADSMLIRAGSGLAGEAAADSAGVPPGVAKDTLIVPLDDEDALDAVFARHGDEIAAAIIEPVPANHGLLPQRHVLLETLARHCKSTGALLIFDEVITGFRLAFGGYAEISGICPDIVTWGKVIGGGFPVGAIAGCRELMNLFAPAGPVYQAGTLSANPVAMAAGLATLASLLDGSVYAGLSALGRELDGALADIGGLRVQRQESIFWLAAAGPGPIMRSTASLPAGPGEAYARWFRQSLAAGVYLPPSPYEVAFLSSAHAADDIDKLRKALTGRTRTT